MKLEIKNLTGKMAHHNGVYKIVKNGDGEALEYLHDGVKCLTSMAILEKIGKENYEYIE